jgi:hypothetical protein
MMFLWYFYGSTVGCLQDFYGTSMGFLWDSDGISLWFLCYFHFISMIFLSDFYVPMRFPWYLYDLSMGLIIMGCQLKVSWNQLKINWT